MSSYGEKTGKGRPRIHESKADKQWAYRDRKAQELIERGRIEGVCRRLFKDRNGRYPESWKELAGFMETFVEAALIVQASLQDEEVECNICNL